MKSHYLLKVKGFIIENIIINYVGENCIVLGNGATASLFKDANVGTSMR